MDKFLAQTKATQASRANTASIDIPNSNSTPSTTTGDRDKESTTASQAALLPRGVVLGKDGKPCRTCTDVSSWLAMTKSGKGSSASTNTKNTNTNTNTSTSPISSTSSKEEKPCPPDVTELGRSTWTLLHTLAASYPTTAAASQQSEMSQFLSLFSRLYPCWVCAEDFQAWMKREKPVLSGRAGFGEWMCRAHNEVNRKLGKREFDCGVWEERWRVGWRDGRCD